MNAAAFFHLVRTPTKFTADVRARLDHVEGLVKQGFGRPRRDRSGHAARAAAHLGVAFAPDGPDAAT
jgi:hypothetical protein